MSEIETPDSTRPAAPFRTDTFRTTRPQIVGPDTPETPFPISLSGIVQRGFGRGGKDLGCPTANLPNESLAQLSEIDTGVYYGYAQVPPSEDGPLNPEDVQVFPMAMSLGWNPFYQNKQKTAEIHIIHEFNSDFYGREMRALILGYIRPELDYTSRDALIEDIETDKRVAIRSLERPAYAKYRQDSYFANHRNGNV